MSRMQKIPYDFVFGATVTTKTIPIGCNGYITDIILVNPANTNSVTAALSIQDNEGYELWNSTAKAAGTTTHFPTDMAADVADIPSDIGFKMVVTLSGNAGITGATVKVRLYIKAQKF